MRKSVIAIIVLSTLLLPLMTFAQLLDEPESVTFDAIRNRYLVSNVANGAIVQIDSNGVQSYFNTDLEMTVGLHIIGDTLFAASNGGAYPGLLGFDLNSGEMIIQLPLTGMALLNDIASDTSGFLWVSEYENDRLYRIDRSDFSYIAFGVGVFSFPNGLLFDDDNNRLLIADASFQGPIYALDLASMTLSVAVYTNLAVDGIAEDHLGNIYVSHWGTGSVYMYEPTFTQPRTVAVSGQYNPADIFFNLQDTVLAIPNFGADLLRLVPWWNWQDFDGDNVPNVYDNCPEESNPSQFDTDTDGVGDPCDQCPGFDDYADADGDGLADGCDECTDTDGDGFGNPGLPATVCAIDNCPNDSNPGQEDENEDGLGDACCCLDLAGNVDGDPNDIADMGDLTALIAYLFIPPYPAPACALEANVDGEGEVDIGDLTAMIDYLFITYAPPEACP